MKPQPRSGDHIQQRGNVWHYWRIIPPDCKRTYGKSVESRSLDTMNRTEAKRLAKAIDPQVDRRIREIREASDPAASVGCQPTFGSARASERVTCAEPPRAKKKSAETTLPRVGTRLPRSRWCFQHDSPATCTVRFSSARKEVEGEGTFGPSPRPLPSATSACSALSRAASPARSRAG